VLERRADSELKLINGGLFTLDFLIEASGTPSFGVR